MRTTITLDPDVAERVRRVMRERGLSFKEAVNQAIRAGLSPESGGAFRTPTHRMGFTQGLPWDKAIQMAGELEDEELARKLAARK